jgi:hypothetical protein
VLRSYNIQFVDIANCSEPVIDLGTSVILNLSHPEIAFVHAKLANQKTNRMTVSASLAYCLMMAQRFDAAHDYLAQIVDFNRPPRIDHGKFTLTEYDLTMPEAQRLYHAGLYQDALNVIRKHGLHGRRADELMRACEDRLAEGAKGS